MWDFSRLYCPKCKHGPLDLTDEERRDDPRDEPVWSHWLDFSGCVAAWMVVFHPRRTLREIRDASKYVCPSCGERVKRRWPLDYLK